MTVAVHLPPSALCPLRSALRPLNMACESHQEVA
jgi:hypothetical protein